MKTVLCFGDSNTWGYDPATRSRFPSHVRWTGVIAERLWDGYRVIADAHGKLGEALAEEVRQLIGSPAKA